MSSHIRTSIEEIERLRFDKWPSKPKASMRTVRVGDRCIVGCYDGAKPNGHSFTLYSTAVRGNFSYGDTFEGFHDAMRGAVKLGVLSKKAVDEYHARAQAERDAMSKHWSANAILREAGELGLKLPASFEKQVRKHIRPDEA